MRNASVFCLLALALVGCQNRESPEAVLKTAQTALARNDLKAFRQSLTDEMKAKWGTLAGAAELQALVAGQGVSVEQVELQSRERSRDGTMERETYSAEILRYDATIARVRVSCEVTYQYTCGGMGGMCTPDQYGNGYWCRFPRREGGGEVYCRRDQRDQATMELVGRDCLIAGIQL